MLFLIIHEEFHLETANLCIQKDIRHLNYKKVITILQAIDKNEDDSRYILKNHLKQFRVSFTD